MIDARRMAARRLGIAAGGAPPAVSTTFIVSGTGAAGSSFESITPHAPRCQVGRVRVPGAGVTRHPLWSGS